MTVFVFGWVLRFTHSQKAVLLLQLPVTVIYKINHARLSFGFAVRFGVHFLPMACYCWLGVGGGVQFCRVRTAPKNLLFYGLAKLLLSFYGLRKVRYMLTICAMRSPVVSV